jgi:RimJ/RimL family protein N-acetyltransferase
MRIQTERLSLRPLSERDADAFAALNADPRVMVHFPAPFSRQQSDALLARIQASTAEQGLGFSAVELAGEFIGIVGLGYASFEAPFTPCVEIAWRLARAHWGKGYATEAARASLRYGFEELGLGEVLSWTSPENRASWRVMERLGMVRDPSSDFDHPRVPEGHRLRRHVVYRISERGFRESLERR